MTKKNTQSRKVEKLSGEYQNFDPQKITRSIWYAAQKVGGKDENLADEIGNEVCTYLEDAFKKSHVIKTSEIGELVEKVLIEKGHAKTAKEFIRHRENKKHAHQDKSTLGIQDDIGLSYNTLYILKRRYLKRNEKGEIVETPMGMVKRIAKFLAGVEKTPAKRKKWQTEFENIMKSFEFLPGGRTITNAGKKHAQLANCFVWPLEDDIDDIFRILHESTVIKKHGGGCGYNFSKIRPEGDVVDGIPELAAGPAKIMQMFDLMTNLFRQEGRRESGNMAVLNADHPDIFTVISSKQNDGHLSKTNISVGITDKFMKAAIEDKNWDLINPRTGKVSSTVKARSVLQLMASMAWQTGDPGIINLSAINEGTARANPLLKKMGPIWTTNVCGEIPQYPYESCNLGNLNFVKFIREDGKGNATFDFKRLSEVMAVATRLMDNVVDASWFPVEKVTKAVRDHRRLGIGCVGWAEALVRLGIPYDSEEAFALAEKITKTMYTTAFETSFDLAEEKGPFPLVKESVWDNKKRKPRNVALLTFPPTSGIAVLCETSFGIEPYFAFAYEQNVLGGMRLKTVVPHFLEQLKKRGIYSEELVQKVIENHGSVQGIKEIPADMQKVFKTAHDVNWKDHIKMQAAFQKWTDNAITKTINMPSSATPKDIEDAFMLAWKLKCKGLTVYRDKTKADQVFEFGGASQKEEDKKMCPLCDVPLIEDRNGKCFKCKQCGYATCEV